MNVLIVDHKFCNIDSVVRAVKTCGNTPLVSQNPTDIERVQKLILPGVGNFAHLMRVLNETGWVDAIKARSCDPLFSMLGICLGMQILASRGTEGGDAPGLNLIPGKVLRLERDNLGLRVPHVGWNEVFQCREDQIFTGVDGKDFYFIHSYHFVPENDATILATTFYGSDFVSAVKKGNVYGVQFHPEKSLKTGLTFLANFLSQKC